MGSSLAGLWTVVLSGVVVTSVVYLVLNNSKAVGTLSQGVAGAVGSLGNTARGQ